MQVKSHSVEFRDIPRDRADTSVKDNPVVTFKEDVSFAKDNAASRKDGAKSNSEENNGAVPAGKKPEIKTLYIETTTGEKFWFEEESRYSVRKIEAEDVKKFAVIHIRYIADGLQSHSIVIQSPRLQKALKPVFQYDPEIDSTSPTLQIMPPFDCFIHGLEQLKGVKDEEAHPETKAYMGLLYNMMEEQLKKSVKTREDCLKTQTVAFADLWTIYSPGCGVLYRGRHDNPVGGRQPGYCGHLQAFQVIKGSYKPTKDDKLLYVLECRFIGMWHGLAWYQAEFEIPQYKGHKEFASLPLPPLEGHELQWEFTKLLLERGQKFVNLVTSSSACRKDYEIAAPSWPQCDCGRGEIGVKGRIMLDGENDGLCPGDYKLLQRLQANQYDAVTSVVVVVRIPRHPSPADPDTGTTHDWMDLLVDVIRNVQFNTQPLQPLMLPGAAHASIHTFLTWMAARAKLDEPIHLVGGPGTGKTRTAQAIADVCQKSLYILSAATLGIEPSGADRILQEHFERARKVNAWVLIKSSDEFLRKPTISAPEALQLKATFCRHVDAFSGLVFFSSDRIQDLDPDLQGRISLQIDFPALGPEQRAQL